MTELQHMMLSICFGAVMGSFIANMIFTIQYAIHSKRKRKEKE